MRSRPVRTLITEPLTRCGVVDEDWKYIVVSTLAAFVYSIAFVESVFIVVLLTPGLLCAGVTLSVTLHKRRPPRWVTHQILFLFRRAEAFALRRHPSLRSPLPGVDEMLLVPQRKNRAARVPTSVTGTDAEPPRQAHRPATIANTGEMFDVLELV